MKTSLRILVLLLFAAAYAGSQVPAPQIPLTGNIGSGGIFPLFNSGTLHITTDADYVMSYPEMSANVIKVVSDVSLTAQRNLVAPLSLGFQFTIQNSTTGGQSIQVIGATGNGVIIANGNITTVTSDGANYVASIGGSWPGYPGAGIAASTGSAWRTPLYTDVTALWTTCTTGFMKGDGTCPATAYTLPSTVMQTNQANTYGAYALNLASTTLLTLPASYAVGAYTITNPGATGTLALTSQIPSVGTWGALNYPTKAVIGILLLKLPDGIYLQASAQELHLHRHSISLHNVPIVAPVRFQYLNLAPSTVLSERRRAWITHTRRLS
jgi:hypothetical protein